MVRYIFVTGGVVSGLGKGITTASIGLLLKNSGFSVDAIKFDPYLNIDPGTMSPYEHGEVYVLDDGSETDLDLGHYERFLDTNLTISSSVTSGKIYDSILSSERMGKFLGKNVQLIPNVTNYIQEAFATNIPNSGNHIRLIEIGGSTGDMEGEIFLESFRQFKRKYKNSVLHIHLGYVPYLKSTGEYKTKPFQVSIRELLKNGLQPDVLFARYSIEDGKKLGKSVLEKISLFGNLPSSSVISLPDLDSIYKVPVYLQNSSILSVLEKFVGKNLNPQIPQFFADISNGKSIKNNVTVGIVAKYPKLSDAYLSLMESLKIAGLNQDTSVDIEFIDAELLTNGKGDDDLSEMEKGKLLGMDAIVIAGGFGSRGMEGKVIASKIARENKIPFLGICLGLQMAVVDIARNLVGLSAKSSEMDADLDTSGQTDYVINLIPEQKEIHQLGGTMRLGGYNCTLEENTLAYKLYQKKEIRERHRHRLEVQTEYIQKMEEKGLIISGKHHYKDNEGNNKYLVELIELNTKDHPYFIATQSHPEFLSRPDKPHPLFAGLIRNALLRNQNL